MHFIEHGSSPQRHLPGWMRNVFTALAAVFLLPATALSHPLPQEMVIVSSIFPPYSSGGENEKAEGIYIAIMEELLKPLGAVPKFHILPFKRALALLSDGQADAMVGLFRTPEREDYLHFLEPPYRTNSCKAFFVAKGRGGDVKTYQDLSKLQGIGIVSGYKYFSPFEEDTTLKKDESPNSLTTLQKLVNGRFDAALLHEDIGDYLIANFNLQDKVEKAEFKHSEVAPAYICLSKKSPWIAREKELSDRIKQMVNSGRMENIRQDYLKQLPVGK
ncbi:MAG: transporter substrate-binding domain-containing protein [Desulfovibrio sp.]|nr:transporter substrate-binding domain-containing protein [Desulfovibrio sp.]MBI4958031.1 transporter substrate-binding domain-containing protein [Desulfovibrio sp.]